MYSLLLCLKELKEHTLNTIHLIVYIHSVPNDVEIRR